MATQPTDYKELRKLWYKKLEKSGFKDAENPDGSLKLSSERYATKKFLGLYQTKADYYYMANHFLNTYDFKSNLERVVWEFHTEGTAVRSIAKMLVKNRLVKKTNRTSVWFVIRDLRKIMYAIYRSI